MTESALACNLTITSETLVDVAGCFMGRPSSNGRGRWGQLDGSANIEWQVRTVTGVLYDIPYQHLPP